MASGAEVLWRPRPERAAATQLAAFAAAAGRPLALDAEDGGYAALWEWSVAERAEFWGRVWDFCGVVGERGSGGGPAGDPDSGAGGASGAGAGVLAADRMPGARWFPDARLNFAENLLHAAGAAADAVVLVSRGEDGSRRALRLDDLRAAVARCAAALAAEGVGPGDMVCGWLPNDATAVVAMLAASSLGAVWSSCSPDFGVDGVLDRFGQIAPKVLFACDGYLWKGRTVDIRPKLAEVAAALPDTRVVLVPFADAQGAEFPGAPRLADWLAAAPDRPLTFARLPFDHPLYVMFSSGTTGKPKCIVHGQGGTLLQHLKEHRLHCDLRPGEPLLYYTTTGWMMWNWLVSGLASGARLVLCDGNPFHPDAGALWDVVADEQVAVFGTSAKYLDACKKAGVRPAKDRDLGALRAVLSTGSPLVPESFDWVYAEVKADLQLASITGGTDLISCFALGSPVSPVRRGELQVRGLGMAVEVWDKDGRPRVGEPGELVCTKAFPSMPTGFFGDADGSRYRAAYFEHFPGVWRHGDWVELRASGGLVVYGRSDATLNPGGVRIGTAEIYRQVEDFPEVLEAVVIGQDTGDGDQRVVLFLRMADGAALDDALRERLRARIRSGASPRHVPALILAVDDIPRTRSGKISELAVRAVVHGRPVRNTSALANPESLDGFRGLAGPA